MWSGMRETEIETQRDRTLYERVGRKRDSGQMHGSSIKSLLPKNPSPQLSKEVLVGWVRWFS